MDTKSLAQPPTNEQELLAAAAAAMRLLQDRQPLAAAGRGSGFAGRGQGLVAPAKASLAVRIKVLSFVLVASFAALVGLVFWIGSRW